MLTSQELNALIELAQRAHKSAAEAMWLTALLRRLSAPAPAPEPEPTPTPENPGKDDEQ